MSDFLTPAETIDTLRRGMTRGQCRRDSRRATAALPAGVVVVRGATQYALKVPAALADISGGKALGITEYLPAREPLADGLNEYAANEAVVYVDQGIVATICEEAIADGEDVYVRVTANGLNTQLGAVRNDVDNNGSADTCVKLPGAKFVQTTTAAGVAEVALNLPA